MEYKTNTMNKIDFTENLSKLPIMKNFDSSQIVTNVDNFRKGEKNLFWFFKLAFYLGLGYLLWTYVLPPVMIALGQLFALVATGFFLVFLFFMTPVIIKGIRSLTRFFHKSLIKHDPFAQLELEKQKLINCLEIFRVAMQKIIGLRQDMEREAQKTEQDAKAGQERMLKLQTKANKLKASMDDMLSKYGEVVKGEDEYVSLESELRKVLAESQRLNNQINQNKDLTQKFGVRGNVMKKLSQKLTYVESDMEIKIEDFDATVLMLKKDYDFAKKSNDATSAAKSVLGLKNGFELDYAMEVITNTISANTAMTIGNLKDIENLTSNYNLDSDELYTNLNNIADKIKVGEDIVPNAKQYRNTDYKLTSDDNLKSGNFGEMF